MDGNETGVSSWPLKGPAISTAVAENISHSEGAPRWLLLWVSFWGGFQIMVLEICGFRVLQTNLGSSVIVTGTLLTVVMILLSAGYYVGGILSTRLNSLRTMFSLLTVAPAYSVIVTAFFLDAITTLGQSTRMALHAHTYLGVGLPAALLTLLLYGPPVFIMSMISPYWIRLQSVGSPRHKGDPGTQSGFFMALSTLGSIAGTMLSSYLLVPFFGVVSSALWTSAVFLAMTTLGWYKSDATPPGRLVVMLGALGIMLACALVPRTADRDPHIIYQADSLYGEVQVVQRTDDAGRTLLTYHPSRVYTHSVVYPDEPLRDLQGLMYLVPGLIQPPRDILVLGSAVGGVLRSIELVFPQARVTGVDLDPKVHQVATDIFGVNTRQSALVTADARMHLSDVPARYDLIIVDLFSGEFTPPHCISREFFELVRERLNPRGGVFINTNMSDIHYELDGRNEPFRTIRHLHATLQAAGFRGLFENSFFDSIFAFTEPMSIAELRNNFQQEFADTTRPAALRAAAGLATYTTVGIAARPKQYRPFTDYWMPALLLELKSNTGAIYGALQSTGAVLATGNGTTPVAQVVLHQLLAERKRGDGPLLRDPSALISALNEVETALPPSAIDEAAKYFRYPPNVSKSVVTASSQWAILADLYGEMLRLGYSNDYEALLPVLDELRSHVASQP